MSERARVTVRKTGSRRFPWEARCNVCRHDHIHLLPDVGAVGMNTRGVGNRTWRLALVAGLAHLRGCHHRPGATP